MKMLGHLCHINVFLVNHTMGQIFDFFGGGRVTFSCKK
jgi:hypothetical protein